MVGTISAFARAITASSEQRATRHSVIGRLDRSLHMDRERYYSGRLMAKACGDGMGCQVFGE